MVIDPTGKIGIFTKGFGGSSGSSGSSCSKSSSGQGGSSGSSGGKSDCHGWGGIGDLATDAEIATSIPGKEVLRKHNWQKSFVKMIQKAVKNDPTEPVVIVGHSWGGDSAIEIAKKLKKKGICVDLLIQIDSVGWGDSKLPSNVRQGLNLYQTDDRPRGEHPVRGSLNIRLDDSSHTDIDNDPRTLEHVRAWTRQLDGQPKCTL